MAGHKNLLVQVLQEAFQEPLEGLGLQASRRLGTWRSGDGMAQVANVWDSKAQDPARGHAFTLEFARSRAERIPNGVTAGSRLGVLVDEEQRRALVRQWNAYVARLPRPDAARVAREVHPSLVDRYWAHFEPIKDFGRLQFLWYRDEVDMREWARVLAAMLPLLLRRSELVTVEDWISGRTPEWRMGEAVREDA